MRAKSYKFITPKQTMKSKKFYNYNPRTQEKEIHWPKRLTEKVCYSFTDLKHFRI